MPRTAKSSTAEKSHSSEHRWTPRNPLGAIALFVFLIETLATVTLKIVADKPIIATLLVLYIILFPTGIAMCFFVILWRKRVLLYGPGDFTSDQFVQILREETDQKVEEALEKARMGSNTRLYYAEGLISRSNREWQDARYAFWEALKRDPKYTPAFLGLADTAVDEAREARKNGDKVRERSLFDEALEECNKAIKIEPEFAGAYMTRAKVYAELDVQSAQVRTDLEFADHWDHERSLRKFIARESAFAPLHETGWFRSLFLDPTK